MDRQAGTVLQLGSLPAQPVEGRPASQLATRVPAGLGWPSMVSDAPQLAGRQISQSALRWPARVASASKEGGSSQCEWWQCECTCGCRCMTGTLQSPGCVQWEVFSSTQNCGQARGVRPTPWAAQEECHHVQNEGHLHR